MLMSLRFLRNGLRNFVYRLRTQGWRAALIRLGGHGLPRLTGIPFVRYSRITPEIYVGPQISLVGKKQLKAWGIASSINMRDEFDDAAHDLGLKHYCYLPTDDGQAPTIQQLEQGIAFIQQMLGQNEKVYIHCRSGVGRAPTMAAAYFMRQGYTMNDAVRLIGQARPFINITLAQLEVLRQLEQRRRLILPTSG